MITLMQPVRDESHQFSDTLEAIQRTAKAVTEASLPELRSQIDATYLLIAAHILPSAQAEGQAKTTRLTQKLMALRERLVYSDFGPAEESALRGVLADLHELVELQAFKDDMPASGEMNTVPPARPSVGYQKLPLPPAVSTTSLGSYALRWVLYRRQDAAIVGSVAGTNKS